MHTRRVDGIRDDAQDPVADLGRAPNRIGGREDEQQGRVTLSGCKRSAAAMTAFLISWPHFPSSTAWRSE